MIGLLGKKLGMTQIFDEEGKQVPVTLIEVGPCHITEIRSKEKHGYNAVQIAFGEAKTKRTNKAKMGHLAKAGAPALRLIREIRTDELEGLEVGGKLGVDNFEVGDFLDLEGVSIGRGFQGVVKRHHFKGDASMSHGSMFGRVPGSIGASSFPSRVMKGMRAAGHMGNANVTLQNIKVVKVDGENNVIALKGSVPGFETSYLMLKMSLKRGKKRKWKVLGTKTSANEAPQQESKKSDSEANS